MITRVYAQKARGAVRVIRRAASGLAALDLPPIFDQEIAALASVLRSLELRIESAQRSGARMGAPPDRGRSLFLAALADWWAAQGWRPTKTIGGPYARVAAIVLLMRNNRLGRSRDNVRLRPQEIAKAIRAALNHQERREAGVSFRKILMDQLAAPK
jgi:hypothetical protein